MSLACAASHCDKRSRAQKAWRLARTARVQAGVRSLGDPPVIALHPGMVPILAKGGIARARIHVHRNPVTPWCDTRVPAEDNQGVLFVGRMTQEKGPDTVARACAMAGVPLTMFGEGPLKEEVSRIYPQARLRGWGGRAEIAAVAGKARLFVLATRQVEAFGLTAFEAGLSGLPVITPDTAMVAEEIVQAGFAEACPPEDVEGLARLVRTLYDDPARLAAMSAAGFGARAAYAISPDAYAQGLMGLYQKLLDARLSSTRPKA
jgi:glycosyltransferase involved in cell wall biosynthesis